MNILCLDTSGGACSAAIAQNEKIIAEQYINNGLTHSATLMTLVDSCFERSGLTPDQLELIAVTNGPGSFTGLRIGMSTAKAFAQSCNCPIVQIGTLSALAANFSWFGEGLVCAMIDARHERAFCRIMRRGKEILQPDTYSLAEIQAFLQQYSGEQILLTGDGADIYGADIMEQVTDAEIAPAHLRYVRASALAEIACRQAQQGNVVSAYDAALEYFVASQAERNMKK